MKSARYLLDVPKLRNRYFVMRHGESHGNRLGIIISDPRNGIKKTYELTEKGRAQVEESIRNCTFLNAKTVILSSDFSRARQTATIARKWLKAGPVIITRRLRERHFGKWEKTSNKNYDKVWAADRLAVNIPQKTTVESVHHVLNRATALVLSLEKRYKNRDILLVSHGDTLQILITGFEGRDPCFHRDQEHLNVAEIRRLG